MSFAQCIDFNEQTIETCAGVPVTFDGSASSLLVTTQEFVDFNSATLPTGWSTSGGATFTQPCGSGIDNTPYYWASTSGGGAPYINSNVYDFSNGGSVVFDMVYAIQGGGAPCEGPDLADEGVSLMYSNDNGNTWVEFLYYSPGGYELPQNPQTTGSVATGATPYTVWNSYTVQIPQAAQTPSTMLRWEQLNSSGTCCDNWGVDNINVQATVSGINYLWDTGATTIPLTVSSAVDTSYTIEVFDGSMNLICSETVFLDIDNSGFDNGVQIITGNFEAGQSTNLVVDGYNDGCPAQSGEMVVKLGTNVTFNSSSPAPDVITPDSLIYNFTNLYKDGPHYTIDMNVTTDAGASNGDTVLIDAFIYPVSGDINPWNNEKNYVFTVSSNQSAFIKRVYPRGDCNAGYVPNDQKLTYTVRFQNNTSGVVNDAEVLDALHMNLDPSTMRVVAASHPMTQSWLNASTPEFTFEDIQLPTQAQNEVESIGYVVFEIDQVQGLTHGAAFSNDAEVRYDGSSPFYTNQVDNTVTDGSHSPVGDTLEINATSGYNWNGQMLTSSGVYTQTFPLPDGCDSTAILLLILESDASINEFDNSISIFPNPAKNQIHVQGSPDGLLRLISTSGQVVLEQNVSGDAVITWNSLATGLYVVEIESMNKVFREKLYIRD